MIEAVNALCDSLEVGGVEEYLWSKMVAGGNGAPTIFSGAFSRGNVRSSSQDRQGIELFEVLKFVAM